MPDWPDTAYPQRVTLSYGEATIGGTSDMPSPYAVPFPSMPPATPPPSSGELPDTHPGDDAGGQFEEHPLTGEWSASPATFLEVLAEAPPGATIELGAGVYRIPATINFRRHAFLIGAGSTRTRLESTGPGPVLRLAESAALALRDLTIAVVNDAPGNVIEATDGALIMERVRVTGARGRRNTSTPETPDDASPEPGYGLVVGGAVWATITSCQFDGNEAGGICVRDACAPTIVDIQTEGGTAGVVFSGQSAGPLTRSRCIGSAIGILVLDRARPVLDANTCRANTHTGIAYRLLATGLARANDCSDNGSAGIWVGDAATPTLESNQCRGNRTAGIVYRRASGGIAVGNSCTGGAIAGIWIGEGACPELESNRCEANGTGLSYTEFGAGSARGNICAANSLFGISVSVLASPFLEANDLSGNVLGTIVDHRMPDSGALIVPN